MLDNKKVKIKNNGWADERCFSYKTVLNPTKITGDIIDQLFTSANYFITGEKGCGKTFAYLTYSYLSSFILSYRLSSNTSEDNQELSH